MEKAPVPPLMDYFRDIKDPRIERNKIYPLIEVIVITILAIMAFAEGWEDIETYGLAKKAWLKKFLPLNNGIPKHDVYRRVFNCLRPEAIEQCFMAWVRDIKQDTTQEIIAVDGKTVRGSFNSQLETSPLHLVSAWATRNRLVLAQVKTQDKSNEITAIPSLLELIALKGCIVTIDAMGCQYKIADYIVEEKADYVFSLKENQPSLYTVKSIGIVQSTRETPQKTSTECRYYVSSLNPDPKLFAAAVRAHWGIENSLHYVLDVDFREDACRIKTGAASETVPS